MLNPLIVKKVLGTLLDLEQSEILKKSDELLKKGNEFIDEVDKHYSIESIDIENFIEKISDNLDDLIEQTANEKKLKPIAGEINISSLGESSTDFMVYWEFYFTDVDGKIIKNQSKKVYEKSILNVESIKRLEQNPMRFEIDPPRKFLK
mgnify:FL=1|jgi:hypothetical protein